MKYYRATFRMSPYSEDFSDILAAVLSEVGFEAFVPTTEGVDAFIRQEFMDEGNIARVIAKFPLPDVSIRYEINVAEDANWNELWEREGFKPIIIDNKIAVHSPNHVDIPNVEYDILINPCQAFGTGSHQTTRMILSELSFLPMDGMKVVDAGTGTGVLTIMAMKRGAARVVAYDIDEWSTENAIANLRLNGIPAECVDIRLGDVSSIKDEKDVNLLMANINRNILLADLPAFCRTLAKGGMLLLSGFYTEDIPMLSQKAKEEGLRLVKTRTEENWTMLLFESDTSGRVDV